MPFLFLNTHTQKSDENAFAAKKSKVKKKNKNWLILDIAKWKQRVLCHSLSACGCLFCYMQHKLLLTNTFMKLLQPNKRFNVFKCGNQCQRSELLSTCCTNNFVHQSPVSESLKSKFLLALTWLLKALWKYLWTSSITIRTEFILP